MDVIQAGSEFILIGDAKGQFVMLMDRAVAYTEELAEVISLKWMQPLRFAMLTKDAKLYISDMKSGVQNFERHT